MWIAVPVVIFMLLVWVGRQVRLGKWKSGPWFRQFRAVRSVLALLALAAGATMMVQGLWPAGIGFIILALLLSGSVRVSGTMSRREPQAAASYTAEEIRAYQTLGLGIGADKTAVRNAWKRLMKDAHPDQGGDAARASALNAARDVLLRRRG
ncbi:J domain-containing protein [Asticcacaulis solisilvae]|uniref:J domain-containing protein n=1 Tax=Asticcacaulis solisilvae TaxID=1217274 RepID=UPI003FD6D1BA